MPLTMLADERTLWVWVTHPVSCELDVALLRKGLASAPDGLRIALGAQGSGLGRLPDLTARGDPGPGGRRDRRGP